MFWSMHFSPSSYNKTNLIFRGILHIWRVPWGATLLMFSTYISTECLQSFLRFADNGAGQEKA